jgi:hypothetical protein
VLRFDVPGYAASTLIDGFQVAFPAGAATEGSTVWYSTVGDPGLHGVTVDGSAWTVADTLGLMELPGGVGLMLGGVYVTELAHDAGSDLYLYSF